MAARTPVTRVRVPRAEREAQMLEVAERVFAERGFQATTMDEVAERVGVTKPLIYDYFGSKEGLLAATIERARGQLLSVLIDAWVIDAEAHVRDRVGGVILAFFRFMDDHERAFALLRNEGSLIGAASDSVERIRQQTAKAFAEGLRTLTPFDLLPDARLDAMAEIVIGGCERLSMWRATHPGTTSEQATELVLTTIWDGLSATADGR